MNFLVEFSRIYRWASIIDWHWLRTIYIAEQCQCPVSVDSQFQLFCKPNYMYKIHRTKDSKFSNFLTFQIWKALYELSIPLHPSTRSDCWNNATLDNEKDLLIWLVYNAIPLFCLYNGSKNWIEFCPWGTSKTIHRLLEDLPYRIREGNIENVN